MKTSVGRALAGFTQHKLTRALILVYLSYLALSLLLVLPLLNWLASPLYQQQTGRPLQHGLMVFNPFTLSLTLKQLADNNPDGSVLWSAERVHINFSLLQSLVNVAPSLDQFAATGVRVAAHKTSAGQWTFDDILQHQAAQPAAPASVDEEAAIPVLVIDNILLAIHEIAFTDASRDETFHSSLENIHFQLRDFSTINEVGQPYEFSAKVVDGGELSWRGTLSLKAGESEGELALKNIALRPVWQYLQSKVNFNLRKADISFAGQYKLHWKDALQWSLTQSQLDLHNLDIRSRRADADSSLAFTRLAVQGVQISSLTRKVDIAAIDLDGLEVASWSEADKVGLLELFSVTGDITSAVDQDAELTEESNPWIARINSAQINAATIDWRVVELQDRHFHLSPVQVKLKNIHTRGDNAATIDIAATLDQLTSLTLTGAVNPVTIAGDLSASLQGLPVNLVNPLLQPYLQAEVLTGQLTAAMQFSLLDGALVQLTTAGSISEFTLRPLATPEELMRWSDLSWQEASVDMAQQRVTMPLVTLAGFDGQLIVTKAGATNLQTLFPPTVESVTEKNPAATTETKPWQFALQKLVLDKASFRFNDQSLTPDFTAAVQRFTGELINFSSTATQRASFDFKGDVDGYAPVTLTGNAQPFLAHPKLDATLTFENMDLGGFSTYSSTYAGWRIDRGLLTANLHYRLADGRIVGSNHIVMDQLQLGEKVRTGNATDIPLRLALALLTDEKGVATLDIGISGTPGDPGFDISQVIRAAVRNSLVKVVSAPFALLAKLVSTPEDLGEIKFNSGSRQLLSKATRKLALLEKALAKRPDLRIEIRGHYDLKTDQRGLQAALLKRTLLAQGLSNDDIKQQNSAWQKAVEKAYRALDLAEDRKLASADQYEKLLHSLAVREQDLVNLAVERSVVVKQFLVEHLNIDNDRVLINSEITCPSSCNSRIVRFDLADLSIQSNR